MGRPSVRRQSYHTPVGVGPNPTSRLNLFPSYADLYRPETPEERLNRIILESLGTRLVTRRPSFSDSQLADVIHRIMSIPTEVRIGSGDAGVTISASGATADIRPDSDTRLGVRVSTSGTPSAFAETGVAAARARVSVEWGGPLRLETSFRDLSLTYTVTPERWEIKFQWGSDSPDLSTLADIFTRGEAGLRGIWGAVRSFSSLDEVSGLRRAVEPHIEPVSTTVRAAARVARVREGISLSFTASGPVSSSGVEVRALVTIRF